MTNALVCAVGTWAGYKSEARNPNDSSISTIPKGMSGKTIGYQPCLRSFRSKYFVGLKGLVSEYLNRNLNALQKVLTLAPIEP